MGHEVVERMQVNPMRLKNTKLESLGVCSYHYLYIVLRITLAHVIAPIAKVL